MRTKYKPWTKPYLEEHQEVLYDESKNLPSSFVLEIGSGKGQFLLDMAKKFPNKYFLGIERNQTCAGFTAKKLVDNEINNALLAFNNADLVFPLLKDKCVEAIFLNFSDPWPKARHAKRRLTANSYFIHYERILKDDGKIFIKTDNKDLYAYSLEVIESSPFKVIAQTIDYKELDEFDTMTEYEKDFRELGQNIYRIILGKKDD